jgi:Sodium / potassium ATPase beta chain
MADKNKIGEYYTRPKELGKWEGFKVFLWNSETSECLGRTGGSWGKLTYITNEISTIFWEILWDCYVSERKKHGRFCSTLSEQKSIGIFFGQSFFFPETKQSQITFT